ncbi:MAG: hypothetical protein N3D74_02075 [Caldisericia bacterium]|nr:hypothetical protein [Caldisericia bacterium]
MENFEKRIKKLEIEFKNLKENLSKIIYFIDKNYGKEIIFSLLKERGFEVLEIKDKRIIFPKDERYFEDYFKNLKSYYFRRILQDTIKKKEFSYDFILKLKEKWGEKVVERYLEKLVKYKIFKKENFHYISNYIDIDNIGNTLEWYIGEILKKEFSIPVISNIEIKNIKEGGDFDIFFLLLGNLSYLEIKSSPPNNISIEEIENFIRRVVEIGIKVSILFIDTTLNIKRNIIDNMEFLLKRVKKNFIGKMIRNGFYKVASGIYVFNSKRSIEESIRIVIDDLLKEDLI